MSPVFVSFATPRYRLHAEGLIRSLKAFGLQHEVLLVTDKGSWQANCQRKAPFLRSMLLKHRAPVVWVDADARVRQRPDLLIEMAAMRQADLAVHDYGLSGGRSEILSGTIYLDDTRGAHALLDAWQSKCVEKPAAYDQQCLQWTLEAWPLAVTEQPGVKVDWLPLRRAPLPAEYCFVFDLFREPFYKRNHPQIGEPVIEHLQHSRVIRAAERAVCQSG